MTRKDQLTAQLLAALAENLGRPLRAYLEICELHKVGTASIHGFRVRLHAVPNEGDSFVQWELSSTCDTPEDALESALAEIPHIRSSEKIGRHA